MITRDQIFAAPRGLVSDPIEVPEWGGAVHVRVMSGAERDAFEVATVPPLGTLRNVRARLVAACACDAGGALLFGPGDVDALGDLDARALDRVFRVAREFNALGADQIEQIKKN